MPTAAQRLLSQAEQNGWSTTVDGDLTTTSAITAWDAIKTLGYGANVAFSESGARLGTALLTARAPSVVADDTIVAYSGLLAKAVDKIIEAMLQPGSTA